MPRLVTVTATNTSPSSAITAAGTVLIQNLSILRNIQVDAVLTGGTGGVLDVYLQRLVNSTWVDWYHFAQLTAGAAASRRTLDPEKATATTVTTVGSGTSPVIAAGTLTASHPGDQVRVLFVAGASTSAGASQVITISGIAD